MTTVVKKNNNMADDKTSETEPFTARRTESLDALGIVKLLTNKSESIFGRVIVDNIM